MKTCIHLGLLFACLTATSACTTAAQSPAESAIPTVSKEVGLSGGDWKLGSFEMDEGERKGAFRTDYNDRTFRSVEVPGEVQRQIGLSGMDLYYQSKALTLVNKKEWWYRKEFRVSKSESGKLLLLKFDGVDYFASVWLNGEKLGEHEGGFVSFSYDVTGKVRFDRPNLLAVKVTCPWIPKGRGFLEYMKGDWTTIDPMDQPHINQPPYFLGPYWDGIPADGNAAFPMGIWRDIRLVSSGFSVIDDLFVSTRSLNADGSATLALYATVKNYAEQDTDATLRFNIIPENFSGESLTLEPQSLSLHPGKNSVSSEIKVKNPHLWWTWDTGEPNLYRLSASLLCRKKSSADSRETVFGIRTIAIKSDMSYWLNGKRMFLKGAWYPMSDYYGSKPTRETFLKDLLLFKAANMNHLVAFTVVEKPDFYDLCDRLGILEIFEFPFNQDGPVDVLSYSNPRRGIFVRESLQQVQSIIVALRNHPSIIEWAAFAEAHAKGGGWGIGTWDFEQYGYGPFSDAIGKLVAALAPGTVYHPSLCDMGEQHFWMGNAGMGNTDSYSQHFEAHTGFVSEYGSLSLPALESWRRELSPEDMWSERQNSLPRWHNLPINISAYSYLSSFDYDGLASLLDRVHQYVDRNIRSVRDLVDDSQLYQAFLLKYATEAYRRKKYSPIHGTRIWDYGEVWPGIRWGIIDYFRVPKMSYYSLKHAQAQFTLSFAYEQALESHPSGTQLRIPVWLVNDYPQELHVKLECQIRDLAGKVVWTKNFSATVLPDDTLEAGTAEWVTPSLPGVYVLTGKAASEDGTLKTSDETFIKVTPALFSRRLHVLLIGQKKYNVPIAEMVRAAGLDVDVIDEGSLQRFDELRNAETIRAKYDVVWLAAFDSLWKFLDDDQAQGLRKAVQQGVGFIHTGGRGSFHGGFGEGACLDFTPLADMLPLELESHYDLVLGQANQRTAVFSEFTPLKGIQASQDGTKWSDGGLEAFGLSGFNFTRLKPETRQVITIQGNPLVALGTFGAGRTVVFTGFTPAYIEQHAEWDDKVIYPYLLDQEFYRNPVVRAYFLVFMELLAAASGEKPQIGYEALLAAREKPLFETLKDLPYAEVELPQKAEVTHKSDNGFHFSFQVANRDGYARLLRIHAEWNQTTGGVPYLTLFNDNYFDLAPGESRTVEGTALFPKNHSALVSGKLIVEGTNVMAKDVMITLGD